MRSELPLDPAADSVFHNAIGLVPTDNEGSPDPLTVFWEVEPGTECVRSLLGLQP